MTENGLTPPFTNHTAPELPAAHRVNEAWLQLKNLHINNRHVTLRRIGLGDREQLRRIAFDAETWTYFLWRLESEPDLDAFIEDAIRETLNGTRIVFAIIDRESGRIAGSCAYGNLSEGEKRLEIGWSWIAQEWRGTATNRAVKLALLDHAFDALQCERVEFKTDVLNLRARAGLRAIGATEEGTLRSFNYMPGGRRRDAVYYSILRGEWRSVRAQHLADFA